MDSFIFYADYEKQIQTANLQEIIGGKQSVLDSIQLAAVEECRSYLVQKYDVSKALQSVSQHNQVNTYSAGKTVYLNATAYSATSTYVLGALTLQTGNVYKCTTAITVAEAFTIGHWTLVGAQYTIYNALYPQPIFDYTKQYAVGDKVFWNDKTYECKITSQILDHTAQLEIGQVIESPIVNVFPDDAVKGIKYWGVGTAYVAPANTLISNTTYWNLGDNRDQKLLEVCINIALYHVHQRIAPQNIPAIRVVNYIGDANDREIRGQRILYPTYSALGWLQAATIGNDITPNLPIKQPKQGGRIRHGGSVKLINQY